MWELPVFVNPALTSASWLFSVAPSMSRHWLTRDCSHQPLEIARAGTGLDFFVFVLVFPFDFSLSSLPKLVSLSLVPVYCSPLDTFSSGCVALLIYFSSHHLSCPSWCSHHFYLDLLTLFFSCLFSPLHFLPCTLSISHQAPTLSIHSLFQPPASEASMLPMCKLCEMVLSLFPINIQLALS